MAEIMMLAERKRPGVRRGKRHSLRTDMTPMVDLGFLLITFFVFTAKLSEPATMDLYMPKETEVHSMPVGESSTLTILLNKDDVVVYYYGKWQDAKRDNKIYRTSFAPAGLRTIIRNKQEQLRKTDKREGKDALMLLIKAGEDATYKNLVDALDEAVINSVKKYMIVKPNGEEADYLASH